MWSQWALHGQLNSLCFTNTKRLTNHEIPNALAYVVLLVLISLVKTRLSLVHTSDISLRTRSIRKQNIISPLGLAKIKQQEFFFVSSFVRLLIYTWTMILWLRQSLCRMLDFIPLFCVLFCSYAYSHVWTRLQVPSLDLTVRQNKDFDQQSSKYRQDTWTTLFN